MRYLKGSKVEVLNTMDPTSPESWRPAEIVSGNGHTYRIRYDGHWQDSSTPVRVPRKAIRPCPPLVVGLRTWSEGDHVEVFEGDSWKPGVVTGNDGSYFSVTILGCSREFIAHGCDVRVRQTWQDSRWIMTDKVDQNSDVQVIDNLAKLRNYFIQNQESCREVKKRTSRKMRAIGDNERVQRRDVKAPYPIPEKENQVDCDLHIRDNASQVLGQLYYLTVNKLVASSRTSDPSWYPTARLSPCDMEVTGLNLETASLHAGVKVHTFYPPQYLQWWEPRALGYPFRFKQYF